MRVVKLFVLVLILFSPLYLLYPGDMDCYTVIAGKEASAEGSVLMGHNEDDSGGNFFVNVRKIPASRHGAGSTVQLKNGAHVRQLRRTRAVLWLQIPGIDFGDAYINDRGVTISSNACPSRENKGEFSNGGIGFMLRRLMARHAGTAREAVKIAGRLISRYGYNSSGRSYAVADRNEAWILQVVKGKHWVAKRVPNDQVAVIANCYTIGTVDLEDKNSFMASKDIINYAKARGWYKPDKDGPFHFARAYAARGNLRNNRNTLRMWRAFDLFAKKKFNPEDLFPFSFIPRKPLRKEDLFRLLRDHYEDTKHDLSENYRKGSPNSTTIRTICTADTRYSFVAELRSNFPPAIADCIWIAFRRPDTNAYSPWYVSITAPPEGYFRGPSDTAVEDHFQLPSSAFSFHPDYAYWYYDRLSEKVDANYKARIKQTRKRWKNFEDYFSKRLKKMEKEFRHLLKTNKFIVLKIITNYVHKLEYRKWSLTSELIRQWE
ncbi:MAG: hypothetical protein GY765_24760 [bacterium]|nr:hypothetical protein [bacterium]